MPIPSSSLLISQLTRVCEGITPDEMGGVVARKEDQDRMPRRVLEGDGKARRIGVGWSRASVVPMNKANIAAPKKPGLSSCEASRDLSIPFESPRALQHRRTHQNLSTDPGLSITESSRRYRHRDGPHRPKCQVVRGVLNSNPLNRVPFLVQP